MHRLTFALAVPLTLASAATACADDIALSSPDGKRLAGAPSFLRLVPPKGWSSTTRLEHPVEDIVEHRTSIGGGGECTVAIDVMAHPQRRPYRRVRILPAFPARVRVVQRGTRGSLHWVIGDQRAALREGRPPNAPPAAPAGAWLSAPGRLLPHHARAIHVRVEVSRELERFGPPDDDGYPVLEPTRRQKAICARRQSDATTKLLPRLLPALRLVPT